MGEPEVHKFRVAIRRTRSTHRVFGPVFDAQQVRSSSLNWKVRKRLDRADGEVEALHGARKAAKRYRYVAELSAPALGRSAARTVQSTTKLQDPAR